MKNVDFCYENGKYIFYMKLKLYYKYKTIQNINHAK